jgi:hypothetical protein
MESVGAKNTADLIHFAIRQGIVAQCALRDAA